MAFTLPDNPPTFQERLAIQYALDQDPSLRPQVLERCRNDAAWFINMFGYTYDPRANAKRKNIAFTMYDFQVDYIHWLDRRLENLEDGIVEKSRDMGVTWVTLGWIVHGWLFRPGFQALVGSRKEDFVDDKTPASHFGKIEYFLRNLPSWMMPRRFKMNQHRMKLKLMNPENGNAITGESSNENFSRQGRYTCIFFDEAAFWDYLPEAWRAAAEASPTRIAVSTPNGLNYFYEIRQSGMYPIKTLHFTLHPDKRTEEWAKRQRGRMTAEDYAQELDISYHRSVRGVVYPGFKDVPVGDFPLDPNMPLFTGIDLGIADDTAIVWIARNPMNGKYRVVDFYKNNDRPIEFYVPFFLGRIPPEIDKQFEYTIEEKIKIASHSGWPTSVNFSDPDVAKRSMSTSSSALDVLREWGIVVWSNAKDNDFMTRKAMTERGIREIEGVDEENCRTFIEALRNARFPQRRAGSMSTSGVVKPIHDWTEAPRTALEFFFVNQPPTVALDYERPAPTRRIMAYNRI